MPSASWSNCIDELRTDRGGVWHTGWCTPCVKELLRGHTGHSCRQLALALWPSHVTPARSFFVCGHLRMSRWPVCTETVPLRMCSKRRHLCLRNCCEILLCLASFSPLMPPLPCPHHCTMPQHVTSQPWQLLWYIRNILAHAALRLTPSGSCSTLPDSVT